jgi:hypothetical protein
MLDNYFIELKESFDTKVDIRWVDKDNTLIGLFIVSDEIYQIFCKNYGDDVWSFKFQHYNKKTKMFSHELTGLVGNSKFTILGTIVSSFEYLIKDKSPNAIVYGAGDNSRGRKNIYSSFCNDISKKYVYKKIDRLQDDKQLFVNFKNDINVEIIFDRIKDIVNDSFGI